MIDSQESKSRRIALAVFGAIVLIMVSLSAISFATTSRVRPVPEAIRFQGQTAVDGKRIFQAYNCMDCHTLVGNGAYFAPDLTTIYGGNGPAWLLAFLSPLPLDTPSKVWPTQDTVDERIASLMRSGDVDVVSKEAYYESYTGAADDVAERGGWGLLMPKLLFSDTEMAGLVAYLNYTSQLNTEGWPPESRANPEVVSRVQERLRLGFIGVRPQPTATDKP